MYEWMKRAMNLPCCFFVFRRENHHHRFLWRRKAARVKNLRRLLKLGLCRNCWWCAIENSFEVVWWGELSWTSGELGGLEECYRWGKFSNVEDLPVTNLKWNDEPLWSRKIFWRNFDSIRGLESNSKWGKFRVDFISIRGKLCCFQRWSSSLILGLYYLGDSDDDDCCIGTSKLLLLIET